jgi:hypothetical protein
MNLLRLFNEPEGHAMLIDEGVSEEIVSQLRLLGISSISNMITAIKTAKHYEMTNDDIVVTVATDSADMYQSRLKELSGALGTYTTLQAAKDMEKCLMGLTNDHFKELTYYDRKAIHNLKYFTWVEQQQKPVEDLNQLWEDRTLWQKIFNQTEAWDVMINEFNNETGVLQKSI